MPTPDGTDNTKPQQNTLHAPAANNTPPTQQEINDTPIPGDIASRWFHDNVIVPSAHKLDIIIRRKTSGVAGMVLGEQGVKDKRQEGQDYINNIETTEANKFKNGVTFKQFNDIVAHVVNDVNTKNDAKNGEGKLSTEEMGEITGAIIPVTLTNITAAGLTVKKTLPTGQSADDDAPTPQQVADANKLLKKQDDDRKQKYNSESSHTETGGLGGLLGGFGGDFIQKFITALTSFFSHFGLNIGQGMAGHKNSETPGTPPENHHQQPPQAPPQRPVMSVDKNIAAGAFTNNDVQHDATTGTPKAITPQIPQTSGANLTP